MPLVCTLLWGDAARGISRCGIRTAEWSPCSGGGDTAGGTSTLEQGMDHEDTYKRFPIAMRYLACCKSPHGPCCLRES